MHITLTAAQEASAEAERLLVKRLDADGNGTISFDEWIQGSELCVCVCVCVHRFK